MQIIEDSAIARSTAKSVTDLLARERRRLHERMDRRPDLDQHPRRRDRGPGPRLQEPGPGPDQRPSRRHRQRLQAVDRRRRAHRDRARPVLRRLRQPEHGRRDQHHPEDRPHRARHPHRGDGGSWALFTGQGAERRHHRQLRLVCRAPMAARATTTTWAAAAASRTPPGPPLRRHRRLRLCRSTRTIGSTSRIRTDGVYDAGFRGSSANIFAFDNRYNQFVRLHLQRQDARTAAAASSSRPTTSTTSTISTIPRPLSAAQRLGARTLRSTTTAASSTSSARASSPRYKPWTATSCCSASTGSADWMRSDRYRAGPPTRSPSSRRRTTTRSRTSSRSMPRTRSASRRPGDGARRRAPDLRQHSARLDAERAHPDPRQQQLPGDHLLGRRDLTGHRLAQHPRRRLERLSRADRDRARRELHGHADRHHDLRQSQPAAGDQPPDRGRRDRRTGTAAASTPRSSRTSSATASTAVTHLVDRRRGRSSRAEQSRRHRRAGPRVPGSMPASSARSGSTCRRPGTGTCSATATTISR